MGHMIIIFQEKKKQSIFFSKHEKSNKSSWLCLACGKNFSTSEDTYKKSTKAYKWGAGVLPVITVAKTIYILG